MKKRYFFSYSVFIAVLALFIHQPVFAASDCENICASQQDTCMNGCSYIKDTDEQNSCIRGCLSGGSSCAKRCPKQESSFIIEFNDALGLTMNDPIYHGTHLCTDDPDCGTGWKCCSGHCKNVDTCN